VKRTSDAKTHFGSFIRFSRTPISDWQMDTDGDRAHTALVQRLAVKIGAQRVPYQTNEWMNGERIAQTVHTNNSRQCETTLTTKNVRSQCRPEYAQSVTRLHRPTAQNTVYLTACKYGTPFYYVIQNSQDMSLGFMICTYHYLISWYHEFIPDITNTIRDITN